MTNQILFRNVMKINPGRLEQFREAVRDAIDFVEREGPQLMVRTFIDEAEMRAVSFQLYRSSEDVLRHWAIADPHIQNVSQHCTVETFDVYGEPSEEVTAGLSQFLSDGRGKIIPTLTGFSRF